MTTIINTEKAPSAIGPYSQGMKYGQLVFTSGQIPIDPTTGEIVSGGITEQSEMVMKNLCAVLKAGGSSCEKALKCTCFLADIADFTAFNEVYAKYMVNKPARSCVAVKTLPKNVLVEVECIATTE